MSLAETLAPTNHAAVAGSLVKTRPGNYFNTAFSIQDPETFTVQTSLKSDGKTDIMLRFDQKRSVTAAVATGSSDPTALGLRDQTLSAWFKLVGTFGDSSLGLYSTVDAKRQIAYLGFLLRNESFIDQILRGET